MPSEDCRILVVAPSQSALRALRRTLSAAGFLVETARNTVDALSLMLEGTHRLALLDAALQDRPLEEALAQFKRLRPGLRILLIRKPFSDQELVESVRKSLKDR